MTYDEKRIEAVARALARVRSPLSDAPEPRDIDYQEARRFIYAHDALAQFPPPPKNWEKELESREAETGGEC